MITLGRVCECVCHWGEAGTPDPHFVLICLSLWLPLRVSLLLCLSQWFSPSLVYPCFIMCLYQWLSPFLIDCAHFYVCDHGSVSTMVLCLLLCVCMFSFRPVLASLLVNMVLYFSLCLRFSLSLSFSFHSLSSSCSVLIMSVSVCLHVLRVCIFYLFVCIRVLFIVVYLFFCRCQLVTLSVLSFFLFSFPYLFFCLGISAD